MSARCDLQIFTDTFGALSRATMSRSLGMGMSYFQSFLEQDQGDGHVPDSKFSWMVDETGEISACRVGRVLSDWFKCGS